MLRRMSSHTKSAILKKKTAALHMFLALPLVLSLVACTGLESAPTPTPTPTPTPITIPEPEPEPDTIQTLEPAPVPPGPIEAKWIEPQVDNNTVSIPVDEIETNWNIHFKLETESGKMNFLTYIVDDAIQVRANICPLNWLLEEDRLICQRGRAIFNAKTGEGIEGPCADYPKASVPYKITDGNIVMDKADLIAAYQDTTEPGLP